MVYESETLKPCHGLTEMGCVEYQELLDSSADKLIFKNRYPLFSKITVILDALNIRIGFLDVIYNSLMEKIRCERR